MDESPPPRIRRRLQMWTCCVVAIIIFAPGWFIFSAIDLSHLADLAGAIALGALVAVIAVLILTTPPDAIRLPPARSVRLIAGITAWLFGIAWLCFDRTALGMIGGLVIVLASIWMARGFIRHRRTPWWTGVVLWHPAAVGPLAWPMAQVAVTVLFVAAVLDVTARTRGRLAAL